MDEHVEFSGQDWIGASSQCDELMWFSVLGSDAQSHCTES